MTKIALLGAGGKMGMRLSANLKHSDFSVDHVEISPAGRERLREQLGIDCVDLEPALAGAAAVVLAVPDMAIGKIAHAIESKLPAGTLLICLDAAGPYAGDLPARPDLSYFITHPCHPPLFNDETDPAAKRDFFGGEKAKQNIVCALMQGPEEHYALGERIARTIYAPVMTSHRVTLQDMAILEPVLSETVAATCIAVIREAVDEAVARGVPEAAARDFVLGHMTIETAILFEQLPGGQFSDGAKMAIERAKQELFKDDWKKVFEPERVMASVKYITTPAG